MGDEGVDLDEGTRIEKQLDALVSGQLSRAVLAIDPSLASTRSGLGKPILQVCCFGLCR